MADPDVPVNTITTMLPQEILFFKILPRLPVKAIPNFMCVCKKWYLFLKSGVFATTYHHHVTNDDHENHHKYLVLPCTNRNRYTYINERNTFRIFDCETPKQGLTESRRLPLFSFNPFSFSYERNISILSSLHGLLCVGIPCSNHFQEYSDLALWNPLTGDHKTLSTKGCHDKASCYLNIDGIFGLYYISSDDDYRLLCISISRTHYPSILIYIYSLKSDSWRKVEATDDFQRRASNWAALISTKQLQPNHILLNEKLYFLKHDLHFRGTFIQSYSVISFDTKTEAFTEIDMPSFGNQMTSCLSFMVLRGCIHVCIGILIDEENSVTNRRCYEMIEFWRMDGDGDWTKVLTYGPMSVFLWNQSLLHLMRDGNLLTQDDRKVYLLDMKNHTKEMVFTCDPSYNRYGYVEEYQREVEPEDILPTAKYIETTVSPNKYSRYVRKWYFKINAFERCTVTSWAEYEAYERAMFEKYGKDVTQHSEENVELWAQTHGGRKKSCLPKIGSSNQKFVMTRTPSCKCTMSSNAYDEESQEQIWEYLLSQMEIEHNERKDIQDQLAKEIETERKARIELQKQISELTSRFGNHYGNAPK